MIGLRIKIFRQEMGYSQKDLANILNVSTRTIVRWEQNSNKPSSDEISKIAKLIGVSEDELMADTVDDNSAVATKSDALDRLSDSVDNLVTGQDMINESIISNRDEYLGKQDAILQELRSQNKELLSRLNTYENNIKSARSDLRHKKIRTICVIVTCLIILGMVIFSWIYWWNYGAREGAVEMGTPSYYEIDDGK